MLRPIKIGATDVITVFNTKGMFIGDVIPITNKVKMTCLQIIE